MAIELALTGRKVLLTGASQGIGAGLAAALAGEGCALHLVARDATRLNLVREAIVAASGTEVTCQALDLALPGAADAVLAAAGDIDVLVNNAGAIPGGTLADVDEETWRRAWDLKVYGYINLARACYPRLRARGGGVILNIIGAGGEVLDPDYIAGAAGNAALMAFTRALGSRSLDDRIRVLGINPSPVATERNVTLMRKRAQDALGDADRYPELMRKLPLGRPLEVREVVDLALFLVSDRAAYMSGTIVTIDGGSSVRR